MLPETFGYRRRRRAIVPSTSVPPTPPLIPGSISGCASREKTERTSRHGIAMRLVETQASAGIRGMRAVGQEGDKGTDTDAWAGEGMVYGVDGSCWRARYVLPLMESCAFGSKERYAAMGGRGAGCSSSEGLPSCVIWTLLVRENACTKQEKTHLYHDRVHYIPIARSPSITNKCYAPPASSQPYNS